MESAKFFRLTGQRSSPETLQRSAGPRGISKLALTPEEWQKGIFFSSTLVFHQSWPKWEKKNHIWCVYNAIKIVNSGLRHTPNQDLDFLE